MKLQRIDAKSFLLFGLALLAVVLTACSTPAVGAPCLPEQVPATGFDEREAYIESSSVQCQTRVCMVYHLAGDPRDSSRNSGACTQATTAAAPACDPKDPKCAPTKPVCSSAKDVVDHAYCTCRCKAPANTQFANCACPDGFSCVDVLDQGDPGVRGSYCVKNATANL